MKLLEISEKLWGVFCPKPAYLFANVVVESKSLKRVTDLCLVTIIAYVFPCANVAVGSIQQGTLTGLFLDTIGAANVDPKNLLKNLSHVSVAVAN